MKQKYIIFALLGLIGVSCSNQDLEERYTDAGQVQVTADIAKSRVSFNEADDMTYAYWQTGDAITLSTPTQGNLNYTATVSEDDATAATFAPEAESLKDIADETVYACYPATTITDGIVALPATDEWTDAKPLPFAYAVSSITDSKVNLTFEHTFAFLKLTLDSRPLANVTSTDGDKTVHSLLIKSATESLGVASGTFNFEDKSVNITEGSNEVKFTLGTAFNPSEETERSIYIPILPQSGAMDITISLLHDYDGGQDVLLEMSRQTPEKGFVAGNIYTLALMGNSSVVIEGESAEIHLAEPGMLSKYITDDIKYTIKSLKLSGYLKSNDIRLLRDMAGGRYDNVNSTQTDGQLASLDLSEAYIVEDTEDFYLDSPLAHHKKTKKNFFGDYFFSGCHSLVSINIPNTVDSIGSHALGNCRSLTNINMPDRITKIHSAAFYVCTSLTTVNISEGVTEIADNVFAGCSSLTNINIPSGVTKIGGRAFENCSSLIDINIPEGVTEIGGVAFRACSSLTNINIPIGVTIIGGEAFSGCTSLTDVQIPEGVTEISTNTFSECSSLKSVYIPSTVTYIDNWAFYLCNNLTEFYCNSSVPPGLGGNDPFSDIAYSVKLYVPKESIDAYKESVWKWYFSTTNIIGMDN